jgi:hypothetical protein
MIRLKIFQIFLCLLFSIQCCFSQKLIITDPSIAHFGSEMQIGLNKFEYKSDTKGESTTSTLKVFNENAVIFENNFTVDKSILDYRLLQHKKIETVVKAMQKMDINVVVLLSDQVKVFLSQNFEYDAIHKSQIEGLFFHQAIINTEKRFLQSEINIIECCPHPDYIVGKSYFWCIEDYFIPTSLLKAIFAKHPDLVQEEVKDRIKLSEYINTLTEDSISYDKLYFLNSSKADYLKSLDNIVANQNSGKLLGLGCLFGLGTAHGCCGNYSGCCYLWTWECYAHDEICGNCRPRWFCFSGCVPD